MRTTCAPGFCPIALLLVAAAAPAQNLELDVTGGSMPGTLTIDVHPAVFPVELVLVIPSTNTGPTFVSWFEPLDGRILDVGLELLGLAWIGFTEPDGHYRVTMPIVPEPSWYDTPLYFQAATLLFAPTLFDRISNPDAFRWGGSGTFRDRFVGFVEDRAFATVIPRADRKWMVTAGGRGQLLAQIARDTSEIYDPVSDSFTWGPSLTTARSLHTATLLPNGQWLFAGGVDTNNDPQASCEVYDPVLDTFTPVASMLSPRMAHTATLLANGKVLVTGGLDAVTVTPTQLSAIRDIVNSTEIYDPVANTWTAGPNMATPRAAHAAITRPDGKVLLAGGVSWDNVIIVGWLPAVRRSCDLYDPVANTIAAAPQMGTARSTIDPIDLGGNRWLFAGGISAVTLANPGTPTATAEIYDAVANTWTTVGPMATPRGNHKGWSLGGGTFLLTGGANGTILNPTALATTEVFSISTNTFSAGPAMTRARAGAATFVMPQGQVQLFGGATSGGAISNSVEWYFF